jgi:uncharacterized membrane protein YGL010W
LQAQRIHLQSLFYYFFVPMTVGLELSRFAKLKVIVNDLRTSDVLASMLTDRMVGVTAAALVAVACLPGVQLHALASVSIGSTGLALVAACVVLTFIGAAVAWRTRLIRPMVEMWDRTRGHRGFLWLALAASVLMQGLMGLTVYLGGTALALDVTPSQAGFGVALATLGTAIPISALGIGAGEAVGVIVFILMGIPNSAAVLLASISYAARLVGALEGGCWEVAEGGHALWRGR